MNVSGLTTGYPASRSQAQSSVTPSQPQAQFAGQSHATHSAGQAGSKSNFGLITGLLTCCALVPFTLGVLVMGGVGLAARRTISKAGGLIPNFAAKV